MNLLVALTITLPAPTSPVFEGPGAADLNTFCLTCHSSDYVTTQPPGMSRDFWQATVVKMQKIYGAPIPDDKISAMVDALVTINAKARSL